MVTSFTDLMDKYQLLHKPFEDAWYINTYVRTVIRAMLDKPTDISSRISKSTSTAWGLLVSTFFCVAGRDAKKPSIKTVFPLIETE